MPHLQDLGAQGPAVRETSGGLKFCAVCSRAALLRRRASMPPDISSGKGASSPGNECLKLYPPEYGTFRVGGSDEVKGTGAILSKTQRNDSTSLCRFVERAENTKCDVCWLKCQVLSEIET